MLGNVPIQLNRGEWEDLAHENGSLRAIIVELLIKNQKLRWQLSGHGGGPVQDPRVLMATEGTP